MRVDDQCPSIHGYTVAQYRRKIPIIDSENPSREPKLKNKLVIAAVLSISLAGCSLWPGGDDEPESAQKAVEEKPAEEDVDIEEVYIAKGRLQCEDETGKDLSVTKNELQQAGITVLSSECGVVTGVMPPALCGSTTLHINVHGIDQLKITAAETLGFKSVKSFEKKQGYEIIPCK